MYLFRNILKSLFYNKSKLNNNVLKRTCCTSINHHEKEDARKCNRFFYNVAVEQQMNIQITNELKASQVYLSMAAFFANTNVAMNGCAGFFLRMSDEEREHAFKLINYQCMRGGSVELFQVPSPKQNWINLLNAFNCGLQLEVDNTNALLTLYKITENVKDLTTMDFLTTEYLHEQMKSLQFFGQIISRFKAADMDKCGTYRIDKELQLQFPYEGKVKIF